MALSRKYPKTSPWTWFVAGLRHNIDHAAHGAAVFRHVIAGDHLEFLHGLLGNRGAHSIHRVVHGVGAVHGNFIGSPALPAEVEAAVRGRADTTACRRARPANSAM